MKGTIPSSSITWFETGKQNIQAKEVYSNLHGLKFFVRYICIKMWHLHLNDMEILETKRFIPKEFELGTTLSYPIMGIQ